MSWNYRVIKTTTVERDHLGQVLDIEEEYDMHEVYYDKEGKITSWTKNSVGPSGNTLEEVRSDIARFTKALELPVLEHSEDETKLIEVVE